MVDFLTSAFFFLLQKWRKPCQKILNYLKNNSTQVSHLDFPKNLSTRERTFDTLWYIFTINFQAKAQAYHSDRASIRLLSIIVQVSQRVNISSLLKFHLVRSGRMEQSFHDSLPDWTSFLRSQLPERERTEPVCQLCGPRTIKFQPVGEVEESVRCSTSTWRPHVPRNLQRDPFGMTFRYALPQSRSRLARFKLS